jgi:DNA-binding transcriptional regulator YbjK
MQNLQELSRVWEQLDPLMKGDFADFLERSVLSLTNYSAGMSKDQRDVALARLDEDLGRKLAALAAVEEMETPTPTSTETSPTTTPT